MHFVSVLTSIGSKIASRTPEQFLYLSHAHVSGKYIPRTSNCNGEAYAKERKLTTA